jgi:hypothetical protein
MPGVAERGIDIKLEINGDKGRSSCKNKLTSGKRSDKED